jgi:hypothetical protein
LGKEKKEKMKRDIIVIGNGEKRKDRKVRKGR